MGDLQVFFFPMMSQGHMIPTLDIAKLFAARNGVKSTIITTPLNAHVFTKAIEGAKHSGINISLRTIKFPTAEVGLPTDCESFDLLTSDDMIANFFKAIAMLQDPLKQILQECRPDCLVADLFFPWTTESAGKFNIPRLVFHGISFFALCASENMRLYKPQKTVLSDDEPFVIPNLPHQIKLMRMKLPDHDRQEDMTNFSRMAEKLNEAELRSYGVIVNSFYELEPDYVDHYKNILGRRAWHIVLVSLCNRETKDKAHRGKEASINERVCLKWLNLKKPNSVIYICFGSVVDFPSSQLYEMAIGLEASGQQFIWVVRKSKNEADENDEKWLPEGFEERIGERGLIIRGWAPQLLILDHESVGGFVNHCGWNSTLEGVSAGVPMVTWPVFAEQFYNEKLVTEILRIGVGVGALKWKKKIASGGIGRAAIAKAVNRVMVGEEAEEMRIRARELKDFAKKAIEEGGSSFSDLNSSTPI